MRGFPPAVRTITTRDESRRAVASNVGGPRLYHEGWEIGKAISSIASTSGEVFGSSHLEGAKDSACVRAELSLGFPPAGPVARTLKSPRRSADIDVGRFRPSLYALRVTGAVRGRNGSQKMNGTKPAQNLPGRHDWLLVAALLGVAQPLTWSGAAEAGPKAPPDAGAAKPDVASMSLEELLQAAVPKVYGASRYEQNVTLAPSSVSLITREEMDRFGYRTLRDAFNGLAGTYFGNDRNYSYLGVRGFLRPGDFLGRLLLLLDGHHANDNVQGGFGVGYEAMLDLDLVERIEFIRGPSSSVYGSGAFLGVLNVVTRKGADIQGVETAVEAGGFGTYQARATFGQGFANGLDVLVSASALESGGESELFYPEFASPENPRGRVSGADGERAAHFYTKATLHDLTLSGSLHVRDKEVPTASYGTLFDSGREETTDLRGYVDLKYEGEVADDGRLLARVSYDRFDYSGDYPYQDDQNPAEVILNRDVTVGEWVRGEVQYLQTWRDRYTFTAGVDYQENVRQLQRNFDVGAGADAFRRDGSGREIGAYGQAEVEVGSRLHLNAGVRFDENTEFGGTVNPRGAVVYQPWERTFFKALYGRAFRAPSQFEGYYASSFDYKANPDLQPETIDTYELVWEQYLGKAHRLSVAGYWYDIEDLISQSLDPVDNRLSFDNLESVVGRGVELEWQADWAHGFHTRLSYALQRAEESTHGEELSHSPRHLAKANLLVPIYRDRVTAGFEVQYAAEVRALNGDTVDGFVVANLTLFSRELAKNLDLSASIYNLFDAGYALPVSADHVQSAILQEGRSFRVKLVYRF